MAEAQTSTNPMRPDIQHFLQKEHIHEGDKVPLNAEFMEGQDLSLVREYSEIPKKVRAEDLFRGKKVVLFSTPGAFTPVCHNAHLPGFVEHYDELRNFGVDLVACVTANDPFVLAHWKKSLKADHVLMLSDGNLDFFKETGLLEDRTDKFQGVRGIRFAMLLDDGVVKYLGIGEDVEKQSGVQPILDYLKRQEKQ